MNHPRKSEFIKLFEKSGWSQSKAAERLEMTRGGVNGFVTGPTVPSATALKLFKLVLQEEEGLAIDVTRPQASAMSSDLEMWKQRAKRAERQLESVRRGLRKMYEDTTPGRNLRPSSKLTSEDEALLDTLEERDSGRRAKSQH